MRCLQVRGLFVATAYRHEAQTRSPSVLQLGQGHFNDQTVPSWPLYDPPKAFSCIQFLIVWMYFTPALRLHVAFTNHCDGGHWLLRETLPSGHKPRPCLCLLGHHTFMCASCDKWLMSWWINAHVHQSHAHIHTHWTPWLLSHRFAINKPWAFVGDSE